MPQQGLAVAKKRADRDEGADPKKPTRRRGRLVAIDEDMMPRIGMVASALDLSVPDWINNRLRAILDEEFPRTMRAMGLAPIDEHKK